ncbi:MAG: CBS domain-containing protein [Halovenus sp.]
MDWDDIPVRDVMSEPVREASGDMAVTQVARILCDEQIGSVLVRGNPDGILTDTDIVRAVGDGCNPERTVIAEVRTSPVITVSPDATVRDAAELMADHEIKKLPVLDRESYLGIVTTTDMIDQVSPELDDIIGAFTDD